MTHTEDVRCNQLQSATRLLRSRERSLQHLAQSPHCKARVEAEQELRAVRDTLAATYAQMRQLGHNS